MAWDSNQAGQCPENPDGILSDLNSLSSALERLEKGIVTLQTRFEPAMRTQVAQSKCADKRLPNVVSEIRSRVKGFQIRVLAVCELIDDMKERADI